MTEAADTYEQVGQYESVDRMYHDIVDRLMSPHPEDGRELEGRFLQLVAQLLSDISDGILDPVDVADRLHLLEDGVELLLDSIPCGLVLETKDPGFPQSARRTLMRSDALKVYPVRQCKVLGSRGEVVQMVGLNVKIIRLQEVFAKLPQPILVRVPGGYQALPRILAEKATAGSEALLAVGLKPDTAPPPTMDSIEAAGVLPREKGGGADSAGFVDVVPGPAALPADLLADFGPLPDHIDSVPGELPRVSLPQAAPMSANPPTVLPTGEQSSPPAPAVTPDPSSPAPNRIRDFPSLPPAPPQSVPPFRVR